jgi:hypothetical protein
MMRRDDGKTSCGSRSRADGDATRTCRQASAAVRRALEVDGIS